MRIVLMGPPGAGKGTQAKILAEQFYMAHLSSGDIFRAEKASGSELGNKLAEYMSAGKLAPDDIVVDVMAKAITESDAEGGMLLDGFPRTVAQAETLDGQLSKADQPLDAVVLMTANDELIVQRITGRRSCSKCGRIYQLTFMPPAREGVCDDCDGELTQRSDDCEEVVRDRLKAYYRQTEPVMDYYRTRPGLQIIEVDGDQQADAVNEIVSAALRDLRSESRKGASCGDSTQDA